MDGLAMSAFSPALPRSIAARVLAMLAFAVLAFALVPAVTLAQVAGWEHTTEGLAPIPPLSARVTDLTGTLAPAEQQALDAKLGAWERETGNQLAVLLVLSTQPEPIETYSIRVAEAWKIGRKGKDNGALLVVAKNDRKLRIEVGYGFEGVLTDATSKRIIAETITPLFRQNQFAAGINAGVDRIIGVVGKGEPLPPSTQRKPGPQSFPVPFEWVILFFVVVPILGGVLRRVFGKVGGATVGASLVGGGAWLVAGSVLIAAAAGVLTWFILMFLVMAAEHGVAGPGSAAAAGVVVAVAAEGAGQAVAAASAAVARRAAGRRGGDRDDLEATHAALAPRALRRRRRPPRLSDRGARAHRAADPGRRGHAYR
jgi:uncharacterized protein